MSQVIIRGILTTALASWGNAKGIPIAREGQGFQKPDGAFIELFVIPSKTKTVTLDGTRKRYLGDVILNIWVKDGEGTGEAEGLADELVNLFPVFPKIYDPLSIETIPSVSRSVLDESGYRITPITFSYRLEA